MICKTHRANNPEKNSNKANLTCDVFSLASATQSGTSITSCAGFSVKADTHSSGNITHHQLSPSPEPITIRKA